MSSGLSRDGRGGRSGPKRSTKLTPRAKDEVGSTLSASGTSDRRTSRTAGSPSGAGRPAEFSRQRSRCCHCAHGGCQSERGVTDQQMTVAEPDDGYTVQIDRLPIEGWPMIRATPVRRLLASVGLAFTVSVTASAQPSLNLRIWRRPLVPDPLPAVLRVIDLPYLGRGTDRAGVPRPVDRGRPRIDRDARTSGVDHRRTPTRCSIARASPRFAGPITGSRR